MRVILALGFLVALIDSWLRSPQPMPVLRISGSSVLQVGHVAAYRADYKNLSPGGLIWTVEPNSRATIIQASGPTALVRPDQTGTLRVHVSERGVAAELPVRAEGSDPLAWPGVASLVLSVLALGAQVLRPRAKASGGLGRAAFGVSVAVAGLTLVVGVVERNLEMAVEGAAGLVLGGLGSLLRQAGEAATAGKFAEPFFEAHAVLVEGAERRGVLRSVWERLRQWWRDLWGREER